MRMGSESSPRSRPASAAKGTGTYGGRKERVPTSAGDSAGLSVLRNTIKLAKCTDGEHAAGLALVVCRTYGGVSFDVLDAVQPCPYGTTQIVQCCIALQVDISVTGLLGIERRTEEYQWIVVAAEVAGQHTGGAEPVGSVAYQEGRVFLTPLRFDADMGRQIYDRGPAPGYCEQIGSYLKCFFRIKVLYDDTVRSPFCIGSSVENSSTEAKRNPCRPCCIDTGTSGPGPRIIDALHLYPGMMKPKRITISLVVNSSNHGTP